ncbi:hypothetical protein AVEN_123957-1 [Araneus ventricosus]|uniref:Uncharacterized protein n=1 Tax=Araneus ventricosus TaxID=182803 RepID=A0A4Y2SVC1_ARAVE|nr:hypothetical protein AVEN_263192-1 [Araneus ventricosus]GBN92073.1 hypothetical protein AVEN_255993-1 [Araneus ventricosus]GBN92078.1 hypothetical protein AVEN_123957-1 [Araneus ventricosus]
MPEASHQLPPMAFPELHIVLVQERENQERDERNYLVLRNGQGGKSEKLLAVSPQVALMEDLQREMAYIYMSQGGKSEKLSAASPPAMNN